MNRSPVCLLTIITAFSLSGPLHASEMRSLSPKELLGKLLFFDARLSVPEGQSCATCHALEVGFTGPDEEINKAGAVYEGAAKGRFGNRKPPASSYGGDSPVLHFDKEEKVWVGGMFWDGRATGKRLKDPLAEQAQGPFLNPLEQNIPDTKTLCMMIKDATYASLFEQVWGKGSTDFTYDNLGIPKNPRNPFYGMPSQWNPAGGAFVDTGLGGYLKEAGYQSSRYVPEMGKFKVPTLRNVDKRHSPDFVKAFGHNGYFKSLKEIVHFYNTRDVLGRCEKVSDPRPGENCWPEPEIPSNVNREELGNLGLTEKEEEAIVAFMSTLSDGYAIEK